MKKFVCAAAFFLALAGAAVCADDSEDEEWAEEIASNEEWALSKLRQYAAAQAVFSTENYAVVADNSFGKEPHQYCENFRNLYYGVRNPGDDITLMLINECLADAFAAESTILPVTNEDAPTRRISCNCYLYFEDPAITDWKEEAGLVAYPLEYGKGGKNIFHIGMDGVVRRMKSRLDETLKAERWKTPPLILEEESPKNAPELWEVVDTQ